MVETSVLVSVKYRLLSLLAFLRFVEWHNHRSLSPDDSQGWQKCGSALKSESHHSGVNTHQKSQTFQWVGWLLFCLAVAVKWN